MYTAHKPLIAGLTVADGAVALVLGEREERRLAAGAGLLHAAEEHDLQPREGRHRLERRDQAGRGGEALLRRDLGAGLDRDAVEEAKHRRPAVLHLHHLVARHVTRLDEAERVVDTELRQDANVALGEHLDLAGAVHRRLEGGDLLEECKGDDGLRHHA